MFEVYALIGRTEGKQTLSNPSIKANFLLYAKMLQINRCKDIKIIIYQLNAPDFYW